MRLRLGAFLIGTGLAALLGVGGWADAMTPIWPTTWLQTGLHASRNAVFGSGSGVSWRTQLPGPLRGQAAIVNGRLYIGSNADQVYALDARTGAVLWHAATFNKAMNAPIVADGLVIEGCGDNAMVSTARAGWIRGSGLNGIIAFNAATGIRVWQRMTRGEVMGGMVASGGTLYAATGGGHLYALDIRTGAERYRVAINGVDSMSSLALHQGVIYLVAGGPKSPQVQAFLASNGTLLWHSVGHANADNTPTVGGGEVFTDNVLQFRAGGKWYFHNDIEAFRPDGILAWHHLTAVGPLPQPPHPYASSPATYANRVLFVGSIASGTLYAFAAQTGHLLWKTSLGAPIYSAPLIAGGMVYATTKPGWVYALDAATGKVVGRLRVTGQLGPAYPVLVDGSLYLGTSAGFVYAIPATRVVGKRAG